MPDETKQPVNVPEMMRQTADLLRRIVEIARRDHNSTDKTLALVDEVFRDLAGKAGASYGLLASLRTMREMKPKPHELRAFLLAEIGKIEAMAEMAEGD